MVLDPYIGPCPIWLIINILYCQIIWISLCIVGVWEEVSDELLVDDLILEVKVHLSRSLGQSIIHVLTLLILLSVTNVSSTDKTGSVIYQLP